MKVCLSPYIFVCLKTNNYFQEKQKEKVLETVSVQLESIFFFFCDTRLLGLNWIDDYGFDSCY